MKVRNKKALNLLAFTIISTFSCFGFFFLGLGSDDSSYSGSIFSTYEDPEFAEYLYSNRCRGSDSSKWRNCAPPNSASLSLNTKVGWTHLPIKSWAEKSFSTYLLFDNQRYDFTSSKGPVVTVTYRVKNVLIKGQSSGLELVGHDGEWVIYQGRSAYMDALSVVVVVPDDEIMLSDRFICVHVMDRLGRASETSGEQCNLEIIHKQSNLKPHFDWNES